MLSFLSKTTIFTANIAHNSTALIRSNMSSAASSITRLSGKVAVVTASTDGIGLGIAKRLALEGAKVVISSRKQKNVDAAIARLKSDGVTAVTGLVCHVALAADRKRLFAEAAKLGGGGVDIVVSNAGVNPTVGAVLDCEEEAWDKIFDVNVKASYLVAQEALPYLRKRPSGGRIIFISSIAGYQPAHLLGAYSVSKTALLGLTKAAALQLAEENITVNCVAPGFIPTKFSSAITETDIGQEELKKIPMNKFGTVEDIAGAVAFLASDDASYITGESIVVAGGMLSRL